MDGAFHARWFDGRSSAGQLVQVTLAGSPQGPVLALLNNALNSVVLPGWVKRCGELCGEIYKRVVAPITGVKYEK